MLPRRFGMAELDAAIGALSRQRARRADSAALVDQVRWAAAASYEVEFDARHAHGGTVVLPYGCSDSSVLIATVDLSQLLAKLTR